MVLHPARRAGTRVQPSSVGCHPMKVLSLFSGVGGFDLGLERAGMETVFQCEWDKHATRILEKHWPHVPRWGDVSTLTGEHILSHAPVIDVVAWGSPCQDLSVAGKRAGLSGSRSGLFHEGIRIIKEIRELTNGKYPRISIWENVAGALSSGAGADFGQVLYEMDEAGACFSEWRLLDAQYFGVPQRRRRVFVVSVFDSATAERCPNPLLPVSEGVQRRNKTSRTQGQDAAAPSAPCAEQGRLFDDDISEPIGFSHTQGLSAQPSETAWPTLRTEGAGMAVAFQYSGDRNNRSVSVSEDVAYTLAANAQSKVQSINTQMAVRRLTPLECERLMGWPDNWTAGQADTHRYKQCGNGVASPVATWIAQQLLATDASTTDTDHA